MSIGAIHVEICLTFNNLAGTEEAAICYNPLTSFIQFCLSHCRIHSFSFCAVLKHHNKRVMFDLWKVKWPLQYFCHSSLICFPYGVFDMVIVIPHPSLTWWMSNPRVPSQCGLALIGAW